jgi:spore maturation protein CgeB
MRILLVHSEHHKDNRRWYQQIAAEAPESMEVKCFSITPQAPSPRFSWKELDLQWRMRDRKLLRMYRDLREAAEWADVLLLYNGNNLHPGFLSCLPTFNVFCCFDDPENSFDLSQPVAHHFDAAFYGNVSSAFQYESWGCKRHAFIPNITAPMDVPRSEEADEVLEAKRDVPLIFIGERNTWRQRRMDALLKSFPEAKVFGNGWPDGRITPEEKDQLYRRARISWNIHNSTGPINRRMHELAAYGVLQICDNKTGLGQIYNLEDEVVGFDTVPEAIELTRFYLGHPAEARQIARRAQARYQSDYTATAIWSRIKNQLIAWDACRAKPVPAKTPRGLTPTWITKAVIPVIGKAQYLIKEGRGAARRAQNREKPILFDDSVYLGDKRASYLENTEHAHVNMLQQRLKNGKPAEWPNVVALNWAICSLIGPARQIVEVGSGTGAFAAFASIDLKRQLLCLERDVYAREFAVKRCQKLSRGNVQFRAELAPADRQAFDLMVSIEVIEHVDDLQEYLGFCSSLSDRAIFSTPNRVVVRSEKDFGPPEYKVHVREFDAGELFWLLRQHYDEVHLYYMPDVYVPWLRPMTIADKGTPIIATCERRRRVA